jgi:hypothetical protein
MNIVSNICIVKLIIDFLALGFCAREKRDPAFAGSYEGNTPEKPG